MALQFILGNSGCGKTRFAFSRILSEAAKNRDKNYIVIVPEQFTMQTQRDLVSLEKNHVISNVEVLSFRRMAYRVFSELGVDTLDVLEEAGKNFVLRHVVEEKKDDLVFLNGRLTRPGYITELRSLISEMKQYRILPSDVLSMAEMPKLHGAFSHKMQDVYTLYRGFNDAIDGKFITAEDVLELLAEVLPKSEWARNAVFVFDGFTGFTPNQNAILAQLFEMTDRMDIVVTIDERENFYEKTEDQLFSMPQEEIASVLEIARRTRTEILDPIVLPASHGHRFEKGGMLYFLEQNIFRGNEITYDGTYTEELSIYSCENPRGELRNAAEQIRGLLEQQVPFHKIAIVTPSLDDYMEYAEDIFHEYDIPVYIDHRITPSAHPLMELLRGLFDLVNYDFSRRSVLRVLRCGIPILPDHDVDLLDNYLLACGVRGMKSWRKSFPYQPHGYDEQKLRSINEIRSTFMEHIEPFVDAIASSEGSVRQMATALYQYLDQMDVENYLLDRAEELSNQNLKKLAHVYETIFPETMDLLSKMVELLDEETIDAKEFIEIFDAGVDTLKIGTIPETREMVVFGDLERTRLHEIDYLFVLGMNDAWIPKDDSRGGILSDYERELLKESDIELSPTSRTRAFRQKYYLYSVLTKPSKSLKLSYSVRYSDNSSARPAYLIEDMKKMFDKLRVVDKTVPELSDIKTEEMAWRILANMLRTLREGKKEEVDEVLLRELLIYLRKKDPDQVDALLDQVFYQHKTENLSLDLRDELMGESLNGSVSRIERYASCPFSYFLEYGLSLHEREEFEMNALKVGNIYHDVLNTYSRLLDQAGLTWVTASEEKSKELLEQAITGVYDSKYRNQAFQDRRSEYRIHSMQQSLKNTVDVLRGYALRGQFVPKRFEFDLSIYEKNGQQLKALNYELKNGKKLKMNGRVDRMDTMEEDGTVYIRLIDYKTGDASKVDCDLFMGGINIQLPLYMDAVLEGEGEKAAPGELLYYHVKDPILNAAEDKLSFDATEEDVEDVILSKSSKDGLISNEAKVLLAVDKEASANKSGNWSGKALPQNAKQLDPENFRDVLSTVHDIVQTYADKIAEGEIPAYPYKKGNYSGCSYCAYHAICGFDKNLSGFEERNLEKKQKWEEISNAKLDN